MRVWNNLQQRFKRHEQAEAGINLLVLTMLGVLVALIVAVALGFHQSTELVASLDRSAEQRLVANYLERNIENSVGQQKVQLTWDDAIRHASTRIDPAWADTYIGAFLWNNFQYDRLYLVDPNGRLIRAWVGGKVASDGGGYDVLAGLVGHSLAQMAANRAVLGKPVEFRKLADTRWPFDARGNALTRWAASTVRIGGRVAQMTVASILPDKNMGLLRRTPSSVVAIHYLGPADLAAMHRALLLPGMSVDSLGRQGRGYNSLPLAASDGQVIGWINWRSPERSAVVVTHTRPLFITFLLFLIALMVGGWAIVRLLLRTMAALQASRARAVHESRHDAMTGLPNRSYFIERLEAELTRIVEGGDRDHVVAVAFLDLDHFKYINDTLGHATGDALVQQVAQRSRVRMAPGDLLARIGGDEFVLMRVAKREAGGIGRLGRGIMTTFAMPFNVDGRMIDVTVSCGISFAPDQATTSADLLRKADMALFRAKQRGRGRWRVFTEDMAEEVNRRRELETELRHALQNDTLEMAYQPIVRAADGKIEGVEALLRWNHPVLGEISPALFVPVAEQCGLMNLLGWWMLGRVFEHAAAWPDVQISVNLSPLQLEAHDFADDLAALVRENQVRTGQITFEVTEGLLMERASATFDVLGKLKDLGFGVALDDFGTGYSSLGYLRRFHFDRIKIDRSFVQNIENDLDAQAILKTIVALGKALNARTVAEGVETLVQRQLVLAAGCDLIQGYFYWPALRPEELIALIARSAPPAGEFEPAEAQG